MDTMTTDFQNLQTLEEFSCKIPWNVYSIWLHDKHNVLIGCYEKSKAICLYGKHYVYNHSKKDKNAWNIYISECPPPFLTYMDDYLYSCWYDYLDYDAAFAFFEKDASSPAGACSGVRKGKFFARNFDWHYDYNAEFVVNVPRIQGRNASKGVATGFNILTDQFVKSKETSNMYKFLPFKLVDGMNEHKLVISMNVVPCDYGKNISRPLKDNRVTISASMVNRYLLDYFADAASASKFMRDHMTIYFPEELHNSNYELHWMIADPRKTYLVEVINQHAVITDISDNAYMTNFNQSLLIPNSNGTVYTPATGDAVRKNNITVYGSGLERFNLIVRKYPSIHTLEDMKSLMDQLRYSRAYSPSTSPAWYSEFVGGTLQVNSPVSDFQKIFPYAVKKFNSRSRDDGDMWHTVHTSIYDMESGTLMVIPQETGKVYAF